MYLFLADYHFLLQEIQGHMDYVNDCSFDPEGDYLASVSDDLTCKLWSVNQQYQFVNSFNLTSPGNVDERKNGIFDDED